MLRKPTAFLPRRTQIIGAINLKLALQSKSMADFRSASGALQFLGLDRNMASRVLRTGMRFREASASRVGDVLGHHIDDLFRKSRFTRGQYKVRKDKGVRRGSYKTSKASRVIILDGDKAFKAEVVLKHGNIMVVKVGAKADA